MGLLLLGRPLAVFRMAIFVVMGVAVVAVFPMLRVSLPLGF
jgi:hypothetical protein